jgi:hypothetical protein
MLENTPSLLSMQTVPEYPPGGARTTGRVCISSDPSGAYIFVDGIIATDPRTGEAIKTGRCFEVVEGRRDFTVRSEGYDDYSFYLDVYPGRTVNRSIRLKSGAPGKTLPFGLVGLFLLTRML